MATTGHENEIISVEGLKASLLKFKSDLLTVMGASGENHAPGFVPDTPSTAGTSKFLREDGTWQVPSGTSISATYSLSVGTGDDANKIVLTPSSGTADKITVPYATNAGTVNGKTVEKNVPSNAVFTDTTYESKSASSGGTDVSLVTTGEKYTWNLKLNALTFNSTPSSSNKVATMADIPSSLPANGGTAENISGTVAIDHGGTGATTASAARTNLGLGSLATKSSLSASDIPTLTPSKVGLSNVTNDAQVKRSEMGVASGVATLGEDGKILQNQLPSYVDDVIDLLNITGTAPSTCAIGDKYYNTSSNKIFTATAANTWGSTGETPENGKIYINLGNSKTYRWSGTTLAVISETLALGETSSTAYRGDRGKTAYDHSLSTHARTDATKVEASSTNGNIKINGTETTVYQLPSSDPYTSARTPSSHTHGNITNSGTITSTEVTSATGVLVYDSNNAIQRATASQLRSIIGAGTSSFSGSYNDLSNKPSIPASANNGTFSIKTKVGSNNAVTAADFTANQSSADDITLILGSNITLTTDTSNRTVTIAATNTTYSAATTSAAGLMSADDKTKLNGIASGANAYSHPTGDGNSHVPATGTSNSGKVLTAGSTANSASWQSLPTASSSVAGITKVGASDGAAAYSHGNHVPATETANNAKFLRNDNSWLTVTPSNIGAASSTHTHGNIANGGTLSDTAAAAAGNDYIVIRDADNNKIQTSTIKGVDAADAVSKKHSHSSLTLSTTAQAYDGSHTLALPSSDPYSSARTPASHTHGNINNSGVLTDTAAAAAGNDYVVIRDADNGKVQTSTIKGTDVADAVSKKHSHSSLTLSTTALAYDGSHTLALPSSDPYSSARTPASHTHGNIANDGTIASTVVTAATGILVYDSSNKILRATAALTRSIIGAGTSSFSGSYNDLTNKPTYATVAICLDIISELT